ncbi:MAG: glycosyltransferase family 4 protein [Flavobacteriales bacterium]
MHVVLCTDGIYPHAMGGMQRHSRLLAEHLAKSGKVKLTVIHPHVQHVFDAALGIAEVRIADIDRSKFYLRELWRYSDRVGEQLEELKPDVILSQGYCVWKGIGRFSDRLVTHPHGLEMFQMLTWKERFLGWPFRASLRFILRHSKVCVSLGGKLTAILREQVKGTPCEVVVLPNAVEVPAVPSGLPANKGVGLLFVGRFAFNKGLDVLMTVAERLVQEGKQDLVRFDLAGDGPLLAQYQQAGLPPNVRLLGRVDDAQLAELYKACSAFILPTRFEGMPTVVLEAMAYGKPIIVSEVGATAELVSPHNGYLLPPGDAHALYDAVVAFAAREPAIHAKMGRYSYDRILERFSWHAVTKDFVALFTRIAAG